MSPSHTRKGERLYHYYPSMNLSRNREVPAGSGPARLSAAMVEGAVIAEMMDPEDFQWVLNVGTGNHHVFVQEEIQWLKECVESYGEDE